VSRSLESTFPTLCSQLSWIIIVLLKEVYSVLSTRAHLLNVMLLNKLDGVQSNSIHHGKATLLSTAEHLNPGSVAQDIEVNLQNTFEVLQYTVSQPFAIAEPKIRQNTDHVSKAY
jgi:hypothetical protein